MKNILKKFLPLLLVASIVAMCGVASGCKSSADGSAVMYERHQSNKGVKVKSNIKVRGNNKANGHTTRSY